MRLCQVSDARSLDELTSDERTTNQTLVRLPRAPFSTFRELILVLFGHRPRSCGLLVTRFSPKSCKMTKKVVRSGIYAFLLQPDFIKNSFLGLNANEFRQRVRLVFPWWVESGLNANEFRQRVRRVFPWWVENRAEVPSRSASKA